MKKGEATRLRIADEAAALFNTRGYAATSISDVMAATGLQKGGIYGHYASKDALAVAAFERALARVSVRFDRALAASASPAERLSILIGEMRRHVTDPVVPGGDPLLNAAAEVDDGVHEMLRTRVREAFGQLTRLVRRTVERGQRAGELRADADAEAFAALFVAALEGAVLVGRLFGDVAAFDRIADGLRAVIARDLVGAEV